MSATAVEKITLQAHEPRDANRGKPSPTKSHFPRWRWGLFVPIGCVIVLAVLLGLIQKLLWMRELDYSGIFWTLLSVKWGMFGVALVFRFFICGSISASNATGNLLIAVFVQILHTLSPAPAKVACLSAHESSKSVRPGAVPWIRAPHSSAPPLQRPPD